MKLYKDTHWKNVMHGWGSDRAQNTPSTYLCIPIELRTRCNDKGIFKLTENHLHCDPLTFHKSNHTQK